jgi:hypothetical protein
MASHLLSSLSFTLQEAACMSEQMPSSNEILESSASSTPAL